jgi:hypothetical protein
MINGDVICLGFDENDVEGEVIDVIEKYCGFEFSEYYKNNVMDYHGDDVEDYDAQMAADELQAALNEISYIVDEYKRKVFDAKTQIMRKDIESMITAINTTINEVI